MSTNRRIYLDFNATAPLVPAARDAMVEAMSDVGNPSSVHAEGRKMRDRLERARNQVATLVGRPREQIVFTSGGTEANWLGVMALAAAAEKRGLPKVVATTKIEHPSLLGAVEALRARGWQVVSLERANEAGVVAHALVNHELGTIQETPPTSGLVHVDAVQAAGKLDLTTVRAHALAISAHKIGGPQGAGAIAIEIDDGLPLVDGGHQERGRRAGTENTLGIVGFGAAAAALDVTAWSRVSGLGEQLEAGLRALGASITDGPRREPTASSDGRLATSTRTGDVFTQAARSAGGDVRGGVAGDVRGAVAGDVPGAVAGDVARSSVAAVVGARDPRPVHRGDPYRSRASIHMTAHDPRVGGTINARFAGARGEAIVMALDIEGISVSTGAACTSGSIQPSAVLLGLGYSDEEAREAVRFSLGPTTTAEEITRVLEVLPPIVERARRHR
jgi:cysteine desulfurase